MHELSEEKLLEFEKSIVEEFKLYPTWESRLQTMYICCEYYSENEDNIFNYVIIRMCNKDKYFLWVRNFIDERDMGRGVICWKDLNYLGELAKIFGFEENAKNDLFLYEMGETITEILQPHLNEFAINNLPKNIRSKLEW